jgi:O-antigen ligase
MVLDWIVALYLPFTCFVQGPQLGPTTVTCAAVLSLVGCIMICERRTRSHRPIITGQFLGQPAVLCCLFYYLVGIGSGLFASNIDGYVREVIQRAVIIILPLYLYVFGARRPRVITRALLFYIPAASALAAAVILFALKSGLSAPVYLFGMHKNAVGANCAHLVIICGAFLIAKQFPKLQLPLLAILALGFLGIVGCQARAAMIGAILGLFLMMVAARVRLRNLVGMAITLAVGVGGLAFVLPQETVKSATSSARYSSVAIRENTWKYMSEKLSNDPLMCVGWGNQIVPTRTQINRQIVADAASIFYYDWAQMSLVGLVAQIAMFCASLYLPFSSARRCPPASALASINLAALGIMAARFEHSYLDSFWIGRGPTLAAWAAVGMAIFVRLWLDQSGQIAWQKQRRAGGQTQKVKQISPQA